MQRLVPASAMEDTPTGRFLVAPEKGVSDADTERIEACQAAYVHALIAGGDVDKRRAEMDAALRAAGFKTE